MNKALVVMRKLIVIKPSSRYDYYTLKVLFNEKLNLSIKHSMNQINPHIALSHFDINYFTELV